MIVPTALLILLVVATAAGVAWRVARVGRCTCQRDEPLAGLGALGAVTSRVRQADRTSLAQQPEPLALQPVPYPARRRHDRQRPHPVHTRPRH